MSQRKCIGLLREGKNKWERRAPLTPAAVATLVRKGIDVLVQPSDRRIFRDAEYVRAGATVTEDLSPARAIFGVKEVPAEKLIPNKSYVMFAHVIKGQKENMGLLDACLEKNVRLFDYERITDAEGKRLVAFGQYAGIAGMIDGLRGLGQRMLALGYSTPFLSMSASYMYPTVDRAKAAVSQLALDIQEQGLPSNYRPLNVGFTGTGRVSQGAQEIFQLLPHRMVPAAELSQPRDDAGTTLVGSVLTAQDMVQRKDGHMFDKQTYYKAPELFESVFHEKVAPHLAMLVNCMYWDARFPRLLTKRQTTALARANPDQPALTMLADISCDYGGSVEFMDHATTIDDPFFVYDPLTDEYARGDVEHLPSGIMVMSTDNLPAEFPREASEHFSSKLIPIAEQLADVDPAASFADAVSSGSLEKPIQRACITSEGQLTERFRYISHLRSQETSKPARPSRVVRISGHLFDSGLINQLLDLVEDRHDQFQVRSVHVSAQSKSTCTLRIMDTASSKLEETLAAMTALCDVLPRSEAEISVMDDEPRATPVFGAAPSKTVLVLGSGMVARPLIDYLDQHGMQSVIASNDVAAAQRIATGPGIKHADTMQLNLDHDPAEQIENAIAQTEADLVVSFVPPPFHPTVAEACLSQNTHLLTASYVSDAMAGLHQRAKDAGLVFLNELGLDPGLDHMSACKVFDEIRDSGETLRAFSSVCGGLPAPEVAMQHPLRYKFSWSPMGVLRALSSDAVFKRDGATIHVAAKDLLSHAEPYTGMQVLDLEQVPNRDSIKYEDVYGLDAKNLESMFRGTLRYAGFSALMHELRALGLFDGERRVAKGTAWLDAVPALATSSPEATEAMRSLNMMTGSVLCDGTVIEAFCKQLESCLMYQTGERDMIAMQHQFRTDRREITSSLIVYGSDQPGGDSAMARTVGIPAGIGARLILDGAVPQRGVLTPVVKEIYAPSLAELEEYGIRFTESSRPL